MNPLYMMERLSLGVFIATECFSSIADPSFCFSTLPPHLFSLSVRSFPLPPPSLSNMFIMFENILFKPTAKIVQSFIQSVRQEVFGLEIAPPGDTRYLSPKFGSFPSPLRPSPIPSFHHQRVRFMRADPRLIPQTRSLPVDGMVEAEGRVVGYLKRKWGGETILGGFRKKKSISRDEMI